MPRMILWEDNYCSMIVGRSPTEEDDSAGITVPKDLYEEWTTALAIYRDIENEIRDLLDQQDDLDSENWFEKGVQRTKTGWDDEDEGGDDDTPDKDLEPSTEDALDPLVSH